VLDIRVRNKLREDLGGAYSTSVFSSVNKQPDERYLVGINFGTDPDQVDELVDALFMEIADIQANGPSKEAVATIQEQTLRGREEMFESNGFWMQLLKFYVEHEDENMLDMVRYNEYVEALTAKDIQQAAQDYLLDGQYIQIVLYPEVE